MTQRIVSALTALVIALSLVVSGWNSVPAYAMENPPLIVAHKTLQNDAPENSIPGVQLAGSLNAEAMELDVRFNKSNYPYVIHNDTVDAISNGTGKVRDKWVPDMEALNSADFAPWNNAATYPEYNGLGTDGKPKVHFRTLYWYLLTAKQSGIQSVIIDMKDNPNSLDSVNLHNTFINPTLAGLNIVWMAGNPGQIDAYEALYPNDPIEWWLIETFPEGYVRDGASLVNREVTTFIGPWWKIDKPVIDYYHQYGLKVGAYTTNAPSQDVPANWDRIVKTGGDVLITNEIIDAKAYIDAQE